MRGVDHIDRKALENWVRDKRRVQKKKGLKPSNLNQESTGMSKIVNMYQLYGSNNTALVQPRDAPGQLVVWNRKFAINRQ